MHNTYLKFEYRRNYVITFTGQTHICHSILLNTSLHHDNLHSMKAGILQNVLPFHTFHCGLNGLSNLSPGGPLNIVSDHPDTTLKT